MKTVEDKPELSPEQSSFISKLYEDRVFLFRYLCRRFHLEIQDQEDIVSIVYSQAISNVDKLMSHPNVKGWLVKSCFNSANMHFRSSRKYVSEQKELGQEPNVISELACDEVSDTLKKFSKEEQELIDLYFLEQNSLAAVKKILNGSPPKATLARKVLKLKKAIYVDLISKGFDIKKSKIAGKMRQKDTNTISIL